MARLTRREKATGVGGGLLLGAAVALIGQVLNIGLPGEIGLCMLFAAGLGAFLASGRHGRW